MPVLKNKFRFSMFVGFRFSLTFIGGAPAIANALAFNEEFLSGREGKSVVDLSYFEMGNAVLPGVYKVDVYLNQVLVRREDIVFSFEDHDNKVKPVVSVHLLKRLGVDVGRLKKDGLIPDEIDDDATINLSKAIRDASVDFDVNSLSLRLSIPQVYVRKSSSGFVDPTLWDDGIAAVYSNYQANFSRGISYDGKNDYRYVGLRNGLNIYGWRLRNDSSFTGGTNAQNRFNSNRTYAERDFRSLKSTFSIGELYTSAQGDAFDSVRIRGVRLQTDMGMLPDNEVSYTPVVRGIAESNATVEVSQNGFVIYSANVPPGAFEITEIYPSGSNGDLHVKIIEADGRERTYNQSYSYLPVMAREGSFRYSLALGEYSNEGQPSVNLLEGSAVYGISANVTGFGGLLKAEGYSAGNVGFGLNTSFGGLSADITHSRSDSKRDGVSRGQSLRLLYSKTIGSTETSFTVVGYRYSTEGYRTLSQYVDDISDQRYLNSVDAGHQKSRLDVTINQSLFRRSSVYLTAGETTYWGRPGSSRRLQLGFSSTLKSASYSVAVSRTEETRQYGHPDTQFTASISIPFGVGSRAQQLYTNAISSQRGDSSLNAGISGNLSEDGALNYSAQTAYGRIGGKSGSIGVGLDTPKAKLSANYSQGPNMKQVNWGASGAVVLHKGGITLGQPVGETFGLVEIPGVSGVGLAGYKAIRTDALGYAIVPYMQPYRYNWVGLSSDTLSSDLEVKEASQVVVPTRGAIVSRPFAAQTGRRIQFELATKSGDRIPFGAQAYDDNGKALGMVDNLSRLLVFGVESDGILSIRWEGRKCMASYKLPPRNPQLTYERVQAVCISRG